jgi:hypothetical protein
MLVRGTSTSTAQSGASMLLAASISAAVLLTPLAGAGPALATNADVAAHAIQEYTSLEEKGKFKDLKSLETFRNSYGFKRSISGRVSVKGTSGQWYDVRLDMEVPGALILQVRVCVGVWGEVGDGRIARPRLHLLRKACGVGRWWGGGGGAQPAL